MKLSSPKLSGIFVKFLASPKDRYYLVWNLLGILCAINMYPSHCLMG